MEDFKKETTFTHLEVCDKINKALVYLTAEQLIDLHQKMFPSNNDFEYRGHDEYVLIEYAPMKKGEGDHIVVGAYYELPDGKVAYIYGYHGLKRAVSYYFDDDHGGRSTSFEKVKSWKRRDELKDFPNARDPKLPYVFDLLWDIKHESELKELISEHSEDWLEYEGVIEEIRKNKLTNKFLSNKNIDNL